MADTCIRCDGYWVCGPDPTCNGESGEMAGGSATTVMMAESGGSSGQTATTTETRPWKSFGTISMEQGTYEVMARRTGNDCEVRIEGPK